MSRLTVLMVLCLVSSVQAGELQDLTLTPGAVATTSLNTVCSVKWGRDIRHVTMSMKREVFENYGRPKCTPDKHGRKIEYDHLIPRQLGGADAVKNLWPQCYGGRWNAIMKDRLENRLHKEVCAGRVLLNDAQQDIAKDWRALYQRYWP